MGTARGELPAADRRQDQRIKLPLLLCAAYKRDSECYWPADEQIGQWDVGYIQGWGRKNNSDLFLCKNKSKCCEVFRLNRIQIQWRLSLGSPALCPQVPWHKAAVNHAALIHSSGHESILEPIAGQPYWFTGHAGLLLTMYTFKYHVILFFLLSYTVANTLASCCLSNPSDVIYLRAFVIALLSTWPMLLARALAAPPAPPHPLNLCRNVIFPARMPGTTTCTSSPAPLPYPLSYSPKSTFHHQTNQKKGGEDVVTFQHLLFLLPETNLFSFLA